MNPRALRAFAAGVLLLAVRAGGVSAGQQARQAWELDQAHPENSDSGTMALRVNRLSEARKLTLADFAWLAGNWRGIWGPRVVEQTWMPPQAGEMVGVFRVLENDKTLVVELLSLTETPDRIEFHFRHFTPPLVAWEQAGPTTLKLSSVDSGAAVFVNPAAGQPKRGTLTRIDSDTYISRSEIIPEGNNVQVTEIKFHRETPDRPHGIAKKGGRR